MKRLAWIGLAGLTVLGTYSLVYACDHSAQATVVTTASPQEHPRVVVTRSEKVCGTAAVAPVMTFEVDVPGRTCPRFVHFVATARPEPPANPVVRTARTALTLGRAIRTTVEAVMGTLVNAAAEKTASLV